MHDSFDLDQIMITMDIPRLGELIGAIAAELCELREIDPPDYDGDEMRKLSIAGWRYVTFMHDRAEFARSVENDLRALDAPEHLPKFGGAAPLP